MPRKGHDGGPTPPTGARPQGPCPARRLEAGFAAIAVLLALHASQPLAAIIYDRDGLVMRWDNTIAYTAAFRVGARDKTVTSDANDDDGDRNFAPGLVSNRFDLLSAFDIAKGAFGFDASAALWYDSVYHQRNDNDSPRTFNPISVPHDQFTQSVRNLQGSTVDIVNAFLYGAGEIGGLPFSFRLGRHTLIWGESLFFPENGIAAGQAPIDRNRVLGEPSEYAKDVFLPVTQASAALQFPNGMSLEAYYQFEWRKTRLPGSGSYFSTADYLDAGGERYLLSAGQSLLRSRDQRPPGPGQFGASLRFSLGEIEYGLYALRFDAKEPEIHVRPGVRRADGTVTVIDPSIVNFSTGQIGVFNLVYPRGIQLYGISASGYLGSSNIAAEISTRRNMPLLSAPAASYPGNGADADGPALYAVGDTLHAQVSTITTFGRSSLWDSATLSAELALTERLSITRNAGALWPAADRQSLAFRASFEPTYFEVLPNLAITPSFGIGYYFAGNSTTEYYQHRNTGDIDLGLSGTYRIVWSASLRFSHFVGNASRQPLADRDFVSFSLTRAF